jgi:hypothetical protein
MIRSFLPRAALLATALIATALPAVATPAPRMAVVVGNAAYPGLPPLPGCTASAQAISAVLTAHGYDVLRVDNAGNADAGAQLARLDARWRAAATAGTEAPVPGGTMVVYLCGYSDTLDGRRFLLPVDARIEQPTDLLAQGMLPQSFLRTAGSAGAAGGVLLFDAFALPEHGPDAAAIRGLQNAGFPFGVAAVLHPAPKGAATGTTPLAQAAADALAAPQADAGSVVAAAQATLGAGSTALVFAAPASPVPLLSVVDPPPPPPPAALPEASTDFGLRDVQGALKRLGYYAGPVDGIRGADTAAAIRRLQHELGTTMTGLLTPSEVAALRQRAR